MANKRQLEFFVLRYAPDSVKGEFANIGLVMFEPGASGGGFADVRFTRDWHRVLCLDPQADVEMLEAMERDIRMQLANGPDRDLLIRRIQESFSNLVQLSSIKGCLAEEPRKEIDVLARLYLEGPKATQRRMVSGRQRILLAMRDAFEQAGVWDLLMHGVPVSPYTKAGDPFSFDFGYRVGNSMKLFHAVPMARSVDAAVTLASRYPAIADGVGRKLKVSTHLTAVVDDGLDRKNEQVQFGLAMLEEARITVAAAAEMPAFAETVRLELRA